MVLPPLETDQSYQLALKHENRGNVRRSIDVMFPETALRRAFLFQLGSNSADLLNRAGQTFAHHGGGKHPTGKALICYWACEMRVP